MYCRWLPALAAPIVLAAVSLVSCARQPKGSAIQRIAILRFENLGPDGSVSWMGRALSEIVSQQLTGAPGLQPLASGRLHNYDRLLGARPISTPGVSAEFTQAILSGATRLGYGEFTQRNGRLEARLTIEDPRSQKATQAIEASGPAGDVLGVGASLARAISPRASPYGTRNLAAVAAYTQALESTDAATMEPRLTFAIQADPDFAPPYRLLAQLRGQRQDRAGAQSIIEQALARGNGISELERARFGLEAAELSGDLGARQTALASVVKLDPFDSTATRALGDSAMNRHDYHLAVEAFQKAMDLEPQDAALANSAGYAAAYAGDLAAGMATLRRYESLSPKDANPLDSMGDINLAAGRLAEAEKFYMAAYAKDASFHNQGDLLKAALARLLGADVAGANQFAQRYFDARAQAKDPIVDYRRAQWTWIVGNRKNAMEQMQAFAQKMESGPLRDIASSAYAEDALWTLLTGDHTGASALAAKAIAIGSPAVRGNAIVAAFLAMPSAGSSEWTVRAEQQFGLQTRIKNFALAYALLVNREFHPAQLLFKEMWDSGLANADEGLPILLAGSYLETGRPKEAAPLLRFLPVPNADGLTPYTAFYFPRLFFLRGLLAEKEGRAEDAKAEFKKFLTLSGPTPLLFGEEKIAAAK